MKQRLLVMNGQRILQTERDSQWQNIKVDKAGLLKPGIYNLYLSSQADKTQQYEGVVVYADKDSVYQQITKSSYIRHNRADFDRIPEMGSAKTISYTDSRAVVMAPAIKHAKKLSR